MILKINFFTHTVSFDSNKGCTLKSLNSFFPEIVNWKIKSTTTYWIHTLQTICNQESLKLFWVFKI